MVNSVCVDHNESREQMSLRTGLNGALLMQLKGWEQLKHDFLLEIIVFIAAVL